MLEGDAVRINHDPAPASQDKKPRDPKSEFGDDSQTGSVRAQKADATQLPRKEQTRH